MLSRYLEADYKEKTKNTRAHAMMKSADQDNKFLKWMAVAIISAMCAVWVYQDFFTDKFVSRIELVGCTPDGAWNSLRERLSPKSFWIGQNVTLEMSLGRYSGLSASSECAHIDGLEERVSCVSYWNNRRSSIARCFQTTKRMCRTHGGLC